MYNAVIIGLGQIAYIIDEDPLREEIWTHFKAYNQHSKVSLAAVCDNDQEKLEHFVKSNNPVPSYLDYNLMLQDIQCDIASVCVPTRYHLKIVSDLVKNKSVKALFCEKPMGSNLREAKAINDLCKDNGVILAVNYMRRWDKKYNLIKEYIDNSIYGKLQSIVAYGTTALTMSTSHLIDMMLYYGGPIDWLIGDLQSDFVRIVEGNEDKGGMAMIKFKNGSYGYLKGTSKDQYHYMFDIDLLFSEGRIIISNDGKKIQLWSFSNHNSYIASGYKTLKRLPDINFNIKEERMINAVGDIIYCIEHLTEPKSNGNTALKVHEAIEGITNSSKSHNTKVSF